MTSKSKSYSLRLLFTGKFRGQYIYLHPAMSMVTIINGKNSIRHMSWYSSPLLDLISDWEGFLRLSTAEELKAQKLHERTGRPLGSDRFLEKMEVTLGRVLKPKKPGPKKKKNS